MSIDFLNKYMFEPLSKQEQLTILSKYLVCPCGKDKLQLKETILRHNLRLIIKEADRFCFDKNNLDDYISVCLSSYNRCVERFNPSKGFAFSTFFVKCMYNDMLLYSYRSTLVKSPQDNDKRTTTCYDSETVLKLMHTKPTEDKVRLKDLYCLLGDERLERILESYRVGKKTKEIAREEGVSIQRISELKIKALTKIRRIVK